MSKPYKSRFESFDLLAWAGIPAQFIMARPEPWRERDVPFPFQGARDVEREEQPAGPRESRESETGGYDFRPGYEIREPPQSRRRVRQLPGIEETEADETKMKDKRVSKDPLLYDLDPESKIRASNVIPKASRPSRVKTPPVYGGECRLRVCPSNYTAMEIRGFFGLIDDGSASQGRMLIVHVPGWIKGYFLDLKDGEDIHAAHVNGKVGGVLRILAVGRHRYYSPGHKVSTCTVCVPEHQWERFLLD